MSGALSLPAELGDLTLVRLAREIAVDLRDIETILEHYQIDSETFERIKATPRFQELLRSEIEAWNSALNTQERIKLKAAAMTEEALPEFYARLHDQKESLPAKVELLKFIGRLAGFGIAGASVEGGGGERFSITINLGSDAKLKFEKELPMKTIEGEVIRE